MKRPLATGVAAQKARGAGDTAGEWSLREPATMTEFDTAGLHGSATDSCSERLSNRDVRALTETMTVIDDIGRARDADGLYIVVSGSGSEYLVDAREGACECPDARHRDVTCKHQRRVAYATGDRALPAYVNADAVDDGLGAHVCGTPRMAVPDGGTTAVREPESDEGDDGRPDDCDCGEWNADSDLPCFPCYLDGFETSNDTDSNTNDD